MVMFLPRVLMTLMTLLRDDDDFDDDVNDDEGDVQDNGMDDSAQRC